MEFALWAIGAILMLTVFLLKMVSNRSNSAHKTIETHRKENKADKEKIEASIKQAEKEIYNCRQEIDEKMALITEIHMTKPDIKEYVNTKVDVVSAKIDSLEKLAEKQLFSTENLGKEVSGLKVDIREISTLLAKPSK